MTEAIVDGICGYRLRLYRHFGHALTRSLTRHMGRAFGDIRRRTRAVDLSGNGLDRPGLRVRSKSSVSVRLRSDRGVVEIHGRATIPRAVRAFVRGVLEAPEARRSRTKDDGDQHLEQRQDENRLLEGGGGTPAPATSAVSSAFRPRLP